MTLLKSAQFCKLWGLCRYANMHDYWSEKTVLYSVHVCTQWMASILQAIDHVAL